MFAMVETRHQPAQPMSAGNRSAAHRSRGSAAAFRAVVEERLRNLEREMGEVKGRINGLIFLVLGAVITQLMLRLAQ
jgi:hypothetical protein